MKFLILCTFMILSLVYAEWPSSIPKCKNGDGSCMLNAAQQILQKHSSGLRALNLLPLDPLHVKKIVLERNPDSPVNIDITLTDVDVVGFKNLKLESFEGLKADLSGRTELVGKIPELQFTGAYKVDGRVLVLPIVGEGPCEMIMKNVNFKYSFDMKPVEKNSQTHANAGHVKLELDPEHVHFQFDNLFNGDKALGDNLNLFINENWREIYAESGPGFTKAVSLVLKSVMNTLFEKYPYADMFE